jgi:hypothetical protein
MDAWIGLLASCLAAHGSSGREGRWRSSCVQGARGTYRYVVFFYYSHSKWLSNNLGGAPMNGCVEMPAAELAGGAGGPRIQWPGGPLVNIMFARRARPIKMVRFLFHAYSKYPNNNLVSATINGGVGMPAGGRMKDGLDFVLK